MEHGIRTAQKNSDARQTRIGSRKARKEPTPNCTSPCGLRRMRAPQSPCGLRRMRAPQSPCGLRRMRAPQSPCGLRRMRAPQSPCGLRRMRAPARRMRIAPLECSCVTHAGIPRLPLFARVRAGITRVLLLSRVRAGIPRLLLLARVCAGIARTPLFACGRAGIIWLLLFARVCEGDYSDCAVCVWLRGVKRDESLSRKPGERTSVTGSDSSLRRSAPFSRIRRLRAATV